MWGLLCLSCTVEALQGKRCQDSLLSVGGRSVPGPAKISGGRGRPWGIFFGFYKTRHILLSVSANCTVLRAVVLTQYRRVIDGQTDGIAAASTSLAKLHDQRFCMAAPAAGEIRAPPNLAYGDRGPRARSCTSKTFGVLRVFSPLGGAENLGDQTPQIKTRIR